MLGPKGVSINIYRLFHYRPFSGNLDFTQPKNNNPFEYLQPQIPPQALYFSLLRGIATSLGGFRNLSQAQITLPCNPGLDIYLWINVPCLIPKVVHVCWGRIVPGEHFRFWVDSMTYSITSSNIQIGAYTGLFSKPQADPYYHHILP